ncbi:perlucin-like protein [Mercenaria mercenaria]|uniref:perlucin-like protein n=1 Tax=Mercenaria mercenaria TaxID=6596 RepID=UPI00234FA654|nr:perlucin-like protein [Mercenaria mercenaria]
MRKSIQVHSDCPNGWIRNNGRCYKFQTEKQNWPNARQMCKWHDSDLMAIETVAEQNWFVQQALTFNHSDADDGFWLSGTDWSEEGNWVWESTTEPFRYQIWGDLQPNNKNNSEHCLDALNFFTYAWSDEWCDWGNLQYVYEKPEPVRYWYRFLFGR